MGKPSTKKPAVPAAAAKKKATTFEIVDVVQNSPEWLEARRGIPTASRFKDILSQGEGKMRTRYMRDLAGELLTERPAENFTNKATDRGHEMEPEARDHYARTRFVNLERVGFVKNSGLMRYATVGASPDSLIGDDGGLEIKTMMPALMIELLEKGAAIPPEHRPQLQGNMWVCERAWWDLKIYYPGMPDFTVRVARDDAYIAEMQKEVEIFCFELKRLVEKLRAMGGGLG